MKHSLRLYWFSLAFIGTLFLANSQDKKLNLQEIWGGAFYPEYMDALQSMSDGEHYTLLEQEGNTFVINSYSYADLKKDKTLVSSADLTSSNSIYEYHFSKDEGKLLIATNLEPIYRWSKLGTYLVYDLQTKRAEQLFQDPVIAPTFSPQGDKVAFVYKNNLYLKNLSTSQVTQITRDGEKNAVINGITDWVYEEEFGFVRAYDWSADGNYIAYIRFDEREVPEFSMDIYGETLYPQQEVFKYPKAGEKNSQVKLFIYNLQSGNTKEVVLDGHTDFYLPRIKWTKNPKVLSFQVINRHQNKLELYFYDVTNESKKVVHTEEDSAWVDITDDLTFLDDNSFLWTSESDGYNHIYHYEETGKLKNQITEGQWEVTSLYGVNEKEGLIYYQSTEEGSIYRQVYSIKLNGKGKLRLTEGAGTHSADFSANFHYFIESWSSTGNPINYSLRQGKDGKLIKSILDNKFLLEKLNPYNLSKKEFFELETETGQKLNAWILKPADFDETKSYPLLMYQYSGPGSQMVSDNWGGSTDLWFHMLTQHGVIVACVDGRGTGYRGRNFKKITYRSLGKYEVEDQIAAAKILSKRSYIDPNRIGIWGWSYGGFMSSNCILKGNDIFSMAIAVAPVTSWRFYDTIYTERYLQTPQENPAGYDENSPLTYADQLKGKFLIIHGTGDDNVHVQNTMRMVSELVRSNKQFDMALYPDKNHGIYGGNTRLQLFGKMTEFVLNTFGLDTP